jgi:hypothetical protein
MDGDEVADPQADLMTDTVERFSNRVANYVKYRPHYPREIIGFLEGIAARA